MKRNLIRFDFLGIVIIVIGYMARRDRAPSFDFTFARQGATEDGGSNPSIVGYYDLYI